MKSMMRLLISMADRDKYSQCNGDSVDELHVEFSGWSSVILFRPPHSFLPKQSML